MTHSIYKPLEFVVIVKQTVGPPEAMAAFNSERVARNYMKACAEDKPEGWSYRLVQVTAPVESELVDLAMVMT